MASEVGTAPQKVRWGEATIAKRQQTSPATHVGDTAKSTHTTHHFAKLSDQPPQRPLRVKLIPIALVARIRLISSTPPEDPRVERHSTNVMSNRRHRTIHFASDTHHARLSCCGSRRPMRPVMARSGEVVIRVDKGWSSSRIALAKGPWILER